MNIVVISSKGMNKLKSLRTSIEAGIEDVKITGMIIKIIITAFLGKRACGIWVNL